MLIKQFTYSAFQYIDSITQAIRFVLVRDNLYYKSIRMTSGLLTLLSNAFTNTFPIPDFSNKTGSTLHEFLNSILRTDILMSLFEG